jgi:hypothetical protein
MVMATTETRPKLPREIEQERRAELDDAINHYAHFTDEASRHEARRLRRIRNGSAVATIACPFSD